jgi:hypothetical protein
MYMKEEKRDQEWLKRKYKEDVFSNMYTYEHNAFVQSLKDKKAGIIKNKIKKY